MKYNQIKELPEEQFRRSKGLETEKEKLAREFREAGQDMERNAEIELWDTLSGLQA